ncbi:MAG: GPW/gp25 family protein [Janthinobacterium lividum]
MPSTGVDRNTGQVLRGLDHVRQSVAVIFTTRLLSRLMRRAFGSAVPVLLGRSNLTRPELLRFYTAVHIAIRLWEPRLRSLRVSYPKNSTSGARQGKLGMRLRCRYFPEALSGDLTSDVVDIDL